MDNALGETWRDARRGQILSAAGRVFGRTPFDGASMDEIAHEAGLGKPTLYRYFQSKDALFAAVFEQALDELEERLAAVLGSGAPASDRLRALIGEIVPTFRRHLVSLRFLGETAALADQSNRRIFRERRMRIGSYLAQAIDEGAQEAAIRPVDGARVAQLLIGMLWSATATSGTSDALIGEEVADLVLHGLLPREASTSPPFDGTGTARRPVGATAGVQRHERATV